MNENLLVQIGKGASLTIDKISQFSWSFKFNYSEVPK